MTGPALKIYGERNSGTNFVEQLVKLNLPLKVIPNIPDVPEALRVRARAHRMPWTCRRAYIEAAWDQIALRHDGACLGWKHRLLTGVELQRYAASTDGAVRFVAVTRNPVSWARSMHRNPFHALAPIDPDFSAFLRRPWLGVARERLDDLLLPTPIALWRLKIGAYRQLSQAGQIALIRYEDALTDPEAVISKLATLTDLPPPSEIRLPEGNARRFSKDDRGYADYVRAFDRTAILESVAPDDLTFILEAAGNDQVAALYPDLFETQAVPV
ncbi:MAG: sulfotransferase domain-containing protein [Pseudomonadota bacterium]